MSGTLAWRQDHPGRLTLIGSRLRTTRPVYVQQRANGWQPVAGSPIDGLLVDDARTAMRWAEREATALGWIDRKLTGPVLYDDGTEAHITAVGTNGETGLLRRYVARCLHCPWSDSRGELVDARVAAGRHERNHDRQPPRSSRA